MIEVFHLPGLEPQDVSEWRTRPTGDGAQLRWPVLAPGAMRRLCTRLVAAADEIRDLPVAAVIEGIDAAAGMLARGPLRDIAERALPDVTGYSPEMAGLVLDRMLEDWRRPALERLLAAELPEGALDSFVPRGGLRARAFGPRLALHVAAGNVPGVAVTSLVRTLLLRSATVVKTASGEPVLAALFAHALADAAPHLAATLAVGHWQGGEGAAEEEALAAADVVVFHGGPRAAAALRARLPAHARLVEHGPRVSFGLIGHDSLADEREALATARDAALAVALFDQQGCVSPHVLYVEDGGGVTPRAFAALVAAELERLDETLPRGHVPEADAAAILDARTAAEARAIRGETVDVHAGRGTRSTVIFETDPAFRASCLNRLVYVKPVTRLENVADHVAPYRDVLQTAAIAGAGNRLEAVAIALGRAGVTRVASLSGAPWPPAHGHHDGAGPLRELIRWVDLEVPAAPPD